MGEFITFQRFGEKRSAQELIALLEKNQIECRFEDNSSGLDAQLGGSGFADSYAVKLHKSDFEKANGILIEDAIDDLESIDKDYYLFDFTDTELRDIVAHRDEWNAFDFLLAQKLLKQRGHEVNQEELNALKQQRITELSQPEPDQTTGIILGYICAILGGLFGIFVGWYLKNHKKVLPNGESVYNYSESDRRHGNRIMYLGIFFLIFWVVFKMIVMPMLATGSFSHNG